MKTFVFAIALVVSCFPGSQAFARSQTISDREVERVLNPPPVPGPMLFPPLNMVPFLMLMQQAPCIPVPEVPAAWFPWDGQ